MTHNRSRTLNRLIILAVLGWSMIQLVLWMTVNTINVETVDKNIVGDYIDVAKVNAGKYLKNAGHLAKNKAKDLYRHLTFSPEMKTLYTVDGSLSGKAADILNYPQDPLKNMRPSQSWRYEYSHRRLGDLNVEGDDSNRWSASYSKDFDLRDRGATVAAKVDSTGEYGLQARVQSDLANVEGVVGKDSSSGIYGNLAKYFKGDGWDAQYSAYGRYNPDHYDSAARQEAEGNVYMSQRDALHAHVDAPLNPKGLLKGDGLGWTLGYKRHIVGSEDLSDSSVYAGASIAAHDHGLSGSFNAKAMPADNLYADYDMTAYRSGYRKDDPISVDQSGQLSYRTSPQGGVYAQFRKIDNNPSRLRVGYSYSREEES